MDELTDFIEVSDGSSMIFSYFLMGGTKMVTLATALMRNVHSRVIGTLMNA